MLHEIRDGVMVELREVVEARHLHGELYLRLKGGWQLVQTNPELVWHLLRVIAGREVEITTLSDQERKFIEV